jgi:uncharacterized protein (DUF2147 family)
MPRTSAVTAITLGAFGLACCGAAAANDALGLWSTEGAQAQVRITQCGEEILCGALAWLKEPTDPKTGRAKTDTHNADASLRNRPLIGMNILLEMKPTGTPAQWEGRVYNAEDGKIYSAYLTVTGPSSLKLEGCILGGLICKSQTWSRVQEHGLSAGRASR